MLAFKRTILVIFALGSVLGLRMIATDSIAVIEGQRGANGWYVGDVSVSWQLPDGAVVHDGCRNTLINYDTARAELSCTYATVGQEPFTQSVVVKRDTTPPVPVLNVPLDEPLILEEGVIFQLDASESTDNLSDTRYVVEEHLYSVFGSPLLIGVADARARSSVPSEIVWRIYDEAGNESVVHTEVLVQNAPPAVEALDYIAFSDGWVTLDVLFEDPGVHDAHRVTIDWGDGNTDQVDVIEKGVTATHEYADAHASYLIQVTVMDSDGAVGNASRTVNPAADGTDR